MIIYDSIPPLFAYKLSYRFTIYRENFHLSKKVSLFFAYLKNRQNIHVIENLENREGGQKMQESYNIYDDIAERTNGDIYIGVVGPVRTGKSTFIKKFMDLLVIPNMENEFAAERAKDEMPQSASGKTIMTTEPKFIPNEAVNISLSENANLKIRMIDCVGYIVDGALGHIENDMPRMVNTPWQEEPMPFEQAAEIGTRKVIAEHSTIGLVVTTDGSITDISRESYIDAEKRVIHELKELNKPFVVLLNSAHPTHPSTIELKKSLEKADELLRQNVLASLGHTSCFRKYLLCRVGL
jgi:stage IV sporulation protein A